MEVWLFGVLALVGLFIVINFFSLSIKLLWNGIVGMILLWLFNMVGSLAGLHLEINAVTALVAGFFGVPGVIFMLLYQMLMQ
ncbi:MAG: pro-sigmaK processing inhibitor BofA family protein [Acidaminococcus sp.]|jgi:inhibitor of the pro-sigma K processing machinery|nr:pro-sigmaK processing inhibitor BofA family protein [Acidaminococcus sp.]MCI2100860.1 pro-sigmaK processing inhibitor BofA family protein [Acidaminococcus sp.]MCI2115223.1 pro-sigmaK processing inhibitor BofA family protein [Acidaminococcus sp.]MCI2116644.1 pro-sigmaK processing inhibitor BofA family protein [Acidaminococcus sp.]